MKKNLFVLFAVLIANIFQAQTELARFNNSNAKPLVLNNNITVGDMTPHGVTMSTEGFWYNNSSHSIFKTKGWPTPQTGTVDLNKYIEFRISPNSGYKLVLSEFNFSAGAYGQGKMKIDYSLNNTFSNPVNVVPETAVNGPMSNFSVKGFISPLATNGQTVYLRVYFYSTNQDFMILFKEGGDVGPSFRGTVTSSSTTPIATNDNFTTTVNNDIDLDVLSNDDYSNQINSLSITQPAHGTATVNADKTVKYLPAANFVGNDSFTYKISNNFGVSNSATVNITVNAPTVTTLLRWDNSDYKATSSQGFIEATSLSASGISLSTANESQPVFVLGSNSQLSNSTIDLTKYAQFVISNTSSAKTIEPKKFKFTGRGYNSGNFQIRYSKKQDFSSDVVTLASGTYGNSYEAKSFDFDTALKINPGEKLYVRLYLYNNYSSYVIQYNSGSMGPAVEGLFYNVVYASTDTTWQDQANPHWSNGFPNASKNAIIATDYNTSLYGNFESNGLTVNSGASININEGGYLTVNGQIVNNAGTDKFVIKNDGNLLQNGNGQNTGNVTAQKTALLSKNGYNYWSSPVTGQNLYQFSDGYNQANGGTGTGTPWNRFYVYNEKTDYFVTSIANEITLNNTSLFIPGRGYAIRGKNSFPDKITTTSPTTTF